MDIQATGGVTISYIPAGSNQFLLMAGSSNTGGTYYQSNGVQNPVPFANFGSGSSMTNSFPYVNGKLLISNTNYLKIYASNSFGLNMIQVT